MYFFCPGFDLLKNGLILPFKKHILIYVSSSSPQMPASKTNKWLRRHSIYIKAYFMPFGFKGKNHLEQNHFQVILQGKLWACARVLSQKLENPAGLSDVGCEGGLGAFSCTFDPMSQSLILTFVLWQIVTFSVSLDFYYLQQSSPTPNQKQKSVHVWSILLFHQYSRKEKGKL